VFVPGKPFQANLMFAGRAGTYPSEAPYPQILTRLKRLARDKHSLLQKSVIYRRKKFYSTGSWTTKLAGKMDSMNSQFDELSCYHGAEIVVVARMVTVSSNRF
jgi:hypothetical protein